MKINQNVKLRIGGRKAPAGGKQQLQKYLDEDTLRDAIYGDRPGLAKFRDDVAKIEADFENVLPASLHTTKSGVDFLAFEAGGDWEFPVLYIMYWDGKNIRGYVPMKGNCVNLVTKAAFGNYEDEDEAYAQKYGVSDFEDFDIEVDEASCFEDFEARIEVI